MIQPCRMVGQMGEWKVGWLEKKMVEKKGGMAFWLVVWMVGKKVVKLVVWMVA